MTVVISRSYEIFPLKSYPIPLFKRSPLSIIQKVTIKHYFFMKTCITEEKLRDNIIAHPMYNCIFS